MFFHEHASLEVAGFEPASSGVSIGLLRAQPALDCRGRHHCRRLCRPVANEDVLSGQLVSPLSEPYLMAPTFRSIGLRPGGRRYLSSERELRLGVCFWFRLFNVAPETTARFSHLDDQSRSLSPPGYGLPIGHGGRSVVILPVVAGTGPGQRCDPPLVAARASRAASREASRLAMA